jgi:ketosteroid isomerase-like protein
MSRENVEVVRRLYGALSRQDIEAALDECDDAMEHDWSRSVGPFKGIYRGRDEIRALWISFQEAVDDAAFELEEVIDVEPHVIAVVAVRIRGRGSGIEVVGVGAHVWTLDDGKASGFRLFQDKDDALEAVGLGE